MFNIYVVSGTSFLEPLRSLSRPPRSHFESAQDYLDELFGGVGSLHFLHAEDMFQTTDYVSNLTDLTISDNDVRLRVPRFYTNVPRVRSHIMTKRQDTLKSHMLAYEKRNFSSGSTSWHPGANTEVQEMVDRFFDCYIDEFKWRQVTTEELTANSADLMEWFNSRTPLGKGGLIREMDGNDIIDQSMNRFKLMVKGDTKFKTDYEALVEFPAGQNIVFHRRLTCAHFSHIFCELVLRLRACVLPNVLLFNGLSFEEFADQLDAALSGKPIDSFMCDEIDISKYDKSQNTFTKTVELEIYRRLGLSTEILDLWATSEFFGRATTTTRSFSAEVYSQRRTGAANTWIGNTLINMVLLAQSTDPRLFTAVCFAGDDSLLLAPRLPHISFDTYEIKFDFDVKYYDSASKYFCAKFLISAGGKTQVVPDPLKLFVKFGKERPKEDAVLIENWRSFYDVTAAFTSDVVVSKLVLELNNKYGYAGSAYAACCCINSLRSNPEQFKRLWHELYKKGENLRNKTKKDRLCT